MPLQSGSNLGPYEILSPLGAGGMGEVYRARDTRLGREVAIKILPPLFSVDPDRLARFEREARTLAALNHPNIAHIHGLEVTDGVRALVMELVEGEDLADRLARGPLPLDEAIPIARQIADAMEAAHEQGVVHRDLKPANIKVRDDGTVKVLDFGLAKAMEPAAISGPDAATNSPTLTARGTQMGMILGTAAYMAPEQARGKTVDRRADIWSFGVVLVEMLTGERAFKGEDITEVLAKVIEREPDLTKLPGATPPSLRRLIARCLVKDPKQRIRDIGEARLALIDAERELTQGPPAAATTLLRARDGWIRMLPWALAAALLFALVAVLARGQRPPVAGSAVARLQIALPPGVELYSALGASVSLSPDGGTLAFVGSAYGVRQVYVRRLDQFDVTPVRGTETAVSCVYSPDGRELLVGLSDTSLRRVRLSDRLVEAITPVTSEYLGGWLHNGRAVFARDGRLWMSGATPADAPTQLTQQEPGTTAVESQPVPVPGVNAMLFVSGRPEAPDLARIDALSLDDKTRTTVVERATSPVLTTTGHILFLRDGVMLAAPFDTGTLRITGEAAPILRDMTVVRNRGVSAILTVSGNGVLVYAAANAGQSEMVSVSRTGEERAVLAAPRAANPRISPDGRTLVFEEMGGGLWVHDVERRTLARLTDGSTIAAFPLFTRDGREVVFRSPAGLFRQPIDGSKKIEQIPGTGASEFPTGFTPDGTGLLYTKIMPATAGDIYLIPLAGGTPRVLLSTSAYEGGAQLSPDGRWMVYASNGEIFLQPYPALNRRIQVSAAGGIHPNWNPKGGEIFYRNGRHMMSVQVTATPDGVVLAPPVERFSGSYAYGGGISIPNFAVSADGRQLFLVKEQARASLNVVLNWFEELKRVR